MKNGRKPRGAKPIKQLVRDKALELLKTKESIRYVDLLPYFPNYHKDSVRVALSMVHDLFKFKIKQQGKARIYGYRLFKESEKIEGVISKGIWPYESWMMPPTYSDDECSVMPPKNLRFNNKIFI